MDRTRVPLSGDVPDLPPLQLAPDDRLRRLEVEELSFTYPDSDDGIAGVSFAVANDATYFSYSSTGLGRPNVGGNPAVSQVVMCDQRGNVRAAGGSGRRFSTGRYRARSRR